MSDSAAFSHQGRVRSHNEDTFAADPQLGLWLVADGVGGHACGEVASAIVRDTIVAAVGEGVDLIEAIGRSHRAILAEIDQRSDTAGMGSTVVALVLRGARYRVGWVGDSRAYLFDGTLRQLSEDHSQVNLMLARGDITAEEAGVHPRRNVLAQSLGISHSMRPAPGLVEGELVGAAQFLLCSDGLSDELADDDIELIMASHRSARAQANALLEAALQAGGNDNVTVVVVGDVPPQQDQSSGAAEQLVVPSPAPSRTGKRWWWLLVPLMLLLMGLLVWEGA